MEFVEKIRNSEEDNIELSSDEIDGVVFIPSNFSDNVKCTTDVEPSSVSDEVSSLSSSLSVDSDVIYDLITPVFSGTDDYTFFNNENYIGFDELGSKSFTFIEKDEEIEGDNLEELEELQDENKRLKDELEKYKEKAEEYEEKVQEYKEKEKHKLAEKIVEIRNSKGILDDDCDMEEEVEELKEFSTDVLEKLLKDSKKISKKLSEPQPQTNEEASSKGYESKKEKLRRELFGEGE